ncbi:Uncharacterised protein [Mycobacteroides abscessus subsp. bolletii]|uniref:hypothetical protein n=1 Tax=Mycobacteroides abscessus TaxID=36809 RepID=UPI0009CD51CD|nr:hypothetical protein [Mycobacteroides abscessus]SKU94495.1 Uncharacterised protein [Mycobacteroides abscessus subsp. bolletii]
MADLNGGAITALVYFIPAAATIELYVPSIRSCAPIHVRHDGMPTLQELVDDAEDIVARHFATRNRPRPAERVRLEFRVPREDEMLDPAPPHPAGRVGYGVPGFGHIDPGYIRSARHRPPGSEPVPCPAAWFKH